MELIISFFCRLFVCHRGKVNSVWDNYGVSLGALGESIENSKFKCVKSPVISPHQIATAVRIQQP